MAFRMKYLLIAGLIVGAGVTLPALGVVDLAALSKRVTGHGAGSEPAQAEAKAGAPAGEQAAEPVLPAVTVTTVSKLEVSEDIVVSGTLVPREEILVAPEVEGLAVQEILVEVGDRVTEGQVLARLSRDTLNVQIAQSTAQIARAEAAVAQARTQIAQAKATLDEKSRTLARTESLRKQGYATAARMDQDVAAAQVASAQADAAKQSVGVALADKAALEAQRAELQWRLQRTEVRAPKAGVVSRRNARLGQIGSMASEPLFKIVAGGDIELEADVSDVSMPRIAVGQAALVQPAGMTTQIAGKVRLIAPEIDQVTRLGKVRIALPGDTQVAIGGSARGTIEIGRRSGLTVPLSAVSYDATGAYVQIVDNGAVRTQRVTIGLVGGERVEVVQGLVDGDQVVSRAGTFLREGDKVRSVATSAGLNGEASQ